jgi:hypothetical protein
MPLRAVLEASGPFIPWVRRDTESLSRPLPRSPPRHLSRGRAEGRAGARDPAHARSRTSRDCTRKRLMASPSDDRHPRLPGDRRDAKQLAPGPIRPAAASRWGPRSGSPRSMPGIWMAPGARRCAGFGGKSTSDSVCPTIVIIGRTMGRFKPTRGKNAYCTDRP